MELIEKLLSKLNVKSMKMEGITLIALIITVIIMLILAGVSISALMGNEGLFARTANAADTYKKAAKKENADIESLLNELDETFKGLQGGTIIADLAKNGTLKVGDYIDYDAGVWKTEDLELIDNSIKKYGGSLNGTTGTEEEKNKKLGVNAEKPTVQGQFGGFNIGDSKNNSSTPVDVNWTPRTSGWRIWSINEKTGEVKIIHAGHSETYYHQTAEIENSIKILRNRDCSMYENAEYAVEGSAHFLKGNEAAEWYTKNCLTDEEKTSGLVYELENYDEDIDNDKSIGDNNFYYGSGLTTFVNAEDMRVIEVLENHSYYWLASSRSSNSMYSISPASRLVNSGSNYVRGVRPIVSLKSDFKLKQATEKTEDGWTLWKIVKN